MYLVSWTLRQRHEMLPPLNCTRKSSREALSVIDPLSLAWNTSLMSRLSSRVKGVSFTPRPLLPEIWKRKKKTTHVTEGWCWKDTSHVTRTVFIPFKRIISENTSWIWCCLKKEELIIQEALNTVYVVIYWSYFDISNCCTIVFKFFLACWICPTHTQPAPFPDHVLIKT